MSNTKRILVLAAGICLPFLVGLAFFGFQLLSGKWPGGMRPSYVAVDYDDRLTHEAATATPLISALKNYHDEHSTYPIHAADFVSYLPSPPQQSVNHEELLGWRYEQVGSGYVLSRRLGWDPTLQYRYDGTAGEWVFIPGDGSAERTIVLKP